MKFPVRPQIGFLLLESGTDTNTNTVILSISVSTKKPSSYFWIMIKIYMHKIISEEYKLSLACTHFNLLTKQYLAHSSTLRDKSHQNPSFISVKIKNYRVQWAIFLLANSLQSAVIVRILNQRFVHVANRVRSFPPVQLLYIIFLKQRIF